MNTFEKWFFLSGFIFFALSCQRDDICPPGTETTPLLVIEFYDREDITRQKAVQNLVVRAAGMEEILLGPVTTNAISIPLRTNENVTEYIFTANQGGDSENEDIVTFLYSQDPEYLNRACGFRMSYENLDVTVGGDDENWIISEIILQENVENETEAHISFIH